MSARGSGYGSSGLAPPSSSGALRTNMSSFIRDTVYGLPQRGAGSSGGSGDGPQTVPLGSPRTARTGGSHSSKFAVLNSLQQQQPAPQQQNQPVAGDVIGSSGQQSSSQPPSARGRGLDLASLLAGVGQQPSSQASQASSGGGTAQATPAEPSPSAPHPHPPQTARRVPRTLSGRPRPPVGSGVSGLSGNGLTSSSRRSSGGGSASTRSKPLIQPEAESAPSSARDAEPSAPPRPREDSAAPAVTMNPPAQQVGTTAPSGNQTARGGRPQSAATSDPIDPLSAPSGRAAKAPEPAVPTAAPGTMQQLGGCAQAPDYRGMQPARVLALYESSLSRYERREVLDYDDVYFIGPDAAKTDAPVPNAPNFGYDDDRGDYQVVKNDHIAYRYEVLGELGRGSFGQVLRAKDYKRNCECALKIIRNRRRFHQQAQVEIRILEHLRSRDPEDRSCTVRMLNYFQFRSHTCITFELHAMNLYELTKLNRYQPFPPALIKRFTGQLLVAVSFMWREQIVHCDLKPENILLKQENKTGIKVIDFGSSCFESERVYSYIQSRFYRAPEIMMGMPYGRPIDLWSIGCIICEMAIGFPIFPGENEHDQLLCIMEILGLPPARLVDKSPRKSKFFDSAGQPRVVPNSRNKIHKPNTKDLQSVLRTDDATFVDFILRFLRWDPAERITPNEAMRHPYIAECFHQDTIPGGPATAGQAQRTERSSNNSGSAAAAAQSNSSIDASSSQPVPAPTQPVRNSRPSSGMPEQQPSAPMGGVASSRHTSASTARSTRGPGLHQLGSLGGSNGGFGSGAPNSARGALPSIGAGGSTASSLVPNSARRARGASGAQRFGGGGDMFL